MSEIEMLDPGKHSARPIPNTGTTFLLLSLAVWPVPTLAKRGWHR